MRMQEPGIIAVCLRLGKVEGRRSLGNCSGESITMNRHLSSCIRKMCMLHICSAQQWSVSGLKVFSPNLGFSVSCFGFEAMAMSILKRFCRESFLSSPAKA